MPTTHDDMSGFLCIISFLNNIREVKTMTTRPFITAEGIRKFVYEHYIKPAKNQANDQYPLESVMLLKR